MGADAEMLAFSLGQLTPALGWQFTLEQQRRGVRSVEMREFLCIQDRGAPPV